MRALFCGEWHWLDPPAPFLTALRAIAVHCLHQQVDAFIHSMKLPRRPSSTSRMALEDLTVGMPFKVCSPLPPPNLPPTSRPHFPSLPAVDRLWEGG